MKIGLKQYVNETYGQSKRPALSASIFLLLARAGQLTRSSATGVPILRLRCEDTSCWSDMNAFPFSRKCKEPAGILP